MDIHVWFKGVANVAMYIAETFGETGNLQLLAICPAIFSMIAIIVASGGFLGVINWLLRWVKGRKSAQAMTAFVGVLCFIDDYTNTMIVGSMMRPVTDRFRVSREKLVFLVDATSAPISGLAVISTWIAYEVGLFSQVSAKLNLGIDGYSMFFDAVIYQFYCILMIVFVFVHIFVGRDFGPMKVAEERAQSEPPPKDDNTTSRNGNYDSAMKDIHSPTPRAVNAVVPLKKSLLMSIILVMAWSLKNCCNDLGTDDFLGAFLVRGISSQWFPAIVFIVASLTFFSMFAHNCPIVCSWRHSL